MTEWHAENIYSHPNRKHKQPLDGIAGAQTAGEGPARERVKGSREDLCVCVSVCDSVCARVAMVMCLCSA